MPEPRGFESAEEKRQPLSPLVLAVFQGQARQGQSEERYDHDRVGRAVVRPEPHVRGPTGRQLGGTAVPANLHQTAHEPQDGVDTEDTEHGANEHPQARVHPEQQGRSGPVPVVGVRVEGEQPRGDAGVALCAGRLSVGGCEAGIRVRNRQNVMGSMTIGALRTWSVPQIGQGAVHALPVLNGQLDVARAASIGFP